MRDAEDDRQRPRIYVDATTLIALGTVGELDRLTAFDGVLVVLPTVRQEATTEPAKTNLERFLAREGVRTSYPGDDTVDERAGEILDEARVNGDVRIIGAVLVHTGADKDVAVVSDDRRLRTVARGLGARVTGTIGVIIRAVEEGLSADEGKALVRSVDAHGLHMTGELRERADELIEEAARRT